LRTGFGDRGSDRRRCAERRGPEKPRSPMLCQFLVACWPRPWSFSDRLSVLSTTSPHPSPTPDFWMVSQATLPGAAQTPRHDYPGAARPPEMKLQPRARAIPTLSYRHSGMHAMRALYFLAIKNTPRRGRYRGGRGPGARESRPPAGRELPGDGDPVAREPPRPTGSRDSRAPGLPGNKKLGT